mgnify:CR=1 FL=1
MIYFVGVCHGYQVIGEFPHRIAPSSQLTCHQFPEETTQYQKPFFVWLRKFISENQILHIFEEWTLISDSESSASSLAKELKISYIQIDKFPQITDYELREDDWVEKIIKNFSNENNNGLAIVGDNHCESLKEKIKNKSHIAIEIIRQNTLESILIPKIYNDIKINNS